MNIVTILAVLVFATALSFIEVPKMLKNKSYREFWSYSILLFIGVTLAILKSLSVKLSSPSDWVAWVFSPVSDLIKPIFK
jgi:predicted tellurium resistance membrane protein TerC